MVKLLNNPLFIDPKEYANQPQNEGKIALFDMDSEQVIAEGDSSNDWQDLEKMREQNVENYRIVIVPSSDPCIVSLSY